MAAILRNPADQVAIATALEQENALERTNEFLQLRYYPGGTKVAPPIFLRNEAARIDQFFLGTQEGRLVNQAVRWLVRRNAINGYSVQKMYERLNTTLALGTCRGQAIAFSLSRRAESRRPLFLPSQEKVNSIFFQIRYELEYIIDNYKDEIIDKKAILEKRIMTFLEKQSLNKRRIEEINLIYQQKAISRFQISMEFITEQFSQIFGMQSMALPISPLELQFMQLNSEMLLLQDELQKLERHNVQLGDEILNIEKRVAGINRQHNKIVEMVDRIQDCVTSKWKKSGLTGLAPHTLLKQQMNDAAFFSQVEQALALLNKNREITDILITMQFENSNRGHSILFQLSQKRLFDIHTGLVQYHREADFIVDMGKYLVSQKCNSIVFNPIAKGSEIQVLV